jgi:hypothetical protein
VTLKCSASRGPLGDHWCTCFPAGSRRLAGPVVLPFPPLPKDDRRRVAPGSNPVSRKGADYGPDECRLTVLYLAGRWFAYWRIWAAGDDAPGGSGVVHRPGRAERHPALRRRALRGVGTMADNRERQDHPADSRHCGRAGTGLRAGGSGGDLGERRGGRDGRGGGGDSVGVQGKPQKKHQGAGSERGRPFSDWLH